MRSYLHARVLLCSVLESLACQIIDQNFVDQNFIFSEIHWFGTLIAISWLWISELNVEINLAVKVLISDEPKTLFDVPDMHVPETRIPDPRNYSDEYWWAVYSETVQSTGIPIGRLIESNARFFRSGKETVNLHEKFTRRINIYNVEFRGFGRYFLTVFGSKPWIFYRWKCFLSKQRRIKIRKDGLFKIFLNELNAHVCVNNCHLIY